MILEQRWRREGGTREELGISNEATMAIQQVDFTNFHLSAKVQSGDKWNILTLKNVNFQPWRQVLSI